MDTTEKQRLIDLVFEIGILTRHHADYFANIPREEYAEWVALQLRLAGYETTPRGLSWGVLS